LSNVRAVGQALLEIWPLGTGRLLVRFSRSSRLYGAVIVVAIFGILAAPFISGQLRRSTSEGATSS